MFPTYRYCISKDISLPIEGLEAIFTLEKSLAVSAHMPQEHESSRELLVADCALEGLLSRVVPHMIVQHVLAVESFRAICTFEVLQ
jgi:peroxiredoxin